MRILIIEDDPEIIEVVRNSLAEAGLESDAAASGEEGLRMAAKEAYAAIVLDLMLPGLDGFSVLRELKAAGVSAPVLVASARHSVEDKVFCLNAGSDDYITKPFALAELLARIQVLLRRGQQVEQTILNSEGVRLDMVSRQAERDGQEITLKPKEFALLKFLMEHAGNVVTRAMIMERVWGYNFDPGTKIIDVYICQLRDKIDTGFDVKLIQTVRGTGYAFRRD